MNKKFSVLRLTSYHKDGKTELHSIGASDLDLIIAACVMKRKITKKEGRLTLQSSKVCIFCPVSLDFTFLPSGNKLM